MSEPHTRRPVAFGLNISPSLDSSTAIVSAARTAEDLGFDFVSANDHVHGPTPRLEAWTMLSWIAASTARIRVATRVLGLPYRHPAILAKMAETFDRLSGGRLILGLGAGSGETEYEALGIAVPPLRDRLTALGEAIMLARGIWSKPTMTLEGRFYQARELQIEPKAAHRIPIWLGTVGPSGLSLTGRLADGWIPSLEYAPPDRAPAMNREIDGAARAAGREPADITRVYNLVVRVGEGQAERSSADVWGTPDQVVDQLARFARLGFDAFNFILAGSDPVHQVERLGREVLPLARAVLAQAPGPAPGFVP